MGDSMDKAKQPGLEIEQIFLSVAHFEHRKDALSLPANTQVQLDVEIMVTRGVSQDESRGMLTVEVATREDADPIYRLRVAMVGLVRVDAAAPNMGIGEFLSNSGPAFIFPFLREAVANLTSRGRFGPVWLRPINLNAPDTATGGSAGELQPETRTQ